MAFATVLSALMTLTLMGMVACHFLADRPPVDPPDLAARRRRFRLGWEIRGIVAAVAGPYAAGMLLGYVGSEFALPLALFTAVGLLAAEMTAPNGLHLHRQRLDDRDYRA